MISYPQIVFIGWEGKDVLSNNIINRKMLTDLIKIKSRTII
jgi:hypothetical protein